ncbi:MAG: molybdate ABC transporter substrate-binding protein [Rhizomicrobium sp.]|jgi:molybdate transport system substrate-binding protein
MSVSRFFRTVLAVALLAVVPARAADVTVFAAASLTDALKQVGDAYKHDTGSAVVFSFAASSALARQIEASSGADIFISADVDWMDHLDSRGLIAHASRVDLLGNRLVLIAPAESRIALAAKPHFDLAGALGEGRLALADPAAVPAGKYAKAALTSLGVWDLVESKVVPAENVRVALAYVARGEAPLGIVYATDAKAEPKVRIVATFPDEAYPRIVYPAALTKEAKPEARAFLKYLSGARAKAIFAKAGFLVPGATGGRSLP